VANKELTGSRVMKEYSVLIEYRRAEKDLTTGRSDVKQPFFEESVRDS
jgi:hypothetical protein